MILSDYELSKAPNEGAAEWIIGAMAALILVAAILEVSGVFNPPAPVANCLPVYDRAGYPMEVCR